MSDFDPDPFGSGPSGTAPLASDPFGTGPAPEPAAAESFPYGRHAATEAFQQFTAHSPAGTGLYLTGSPGTGRSTLLTWLFLRSDRDESGTGRIFHAALGARGRGVDDLATAIGAQLGYEVDTAGELLDVLSVDQRAVCIAIGELDEAGTVPTPAGADRLLEQLLVPLAQLPWVRLVAEGPREWAGRLTPTQVVDLDEPRWTDRAAFGRYVDAMCEHAPEGLLPRSPAHPLHGVEGRLRFAHEVAERTYPNFLLAQTTVLDGLSDAAEDLDGPDGPSDTRSETRSGPPSDTRPDTADGESAGGIAGAVHRRLRLWSATAPVAADALLALALAGPNGFDGSEWLAAIALTAHRQVSVGELDDAIERVGNLITPVPAVTTVSTAPTTSTAGPAAEPEERYALLHPSIGAALLASVGPDRERQLRRALAYALAARVPVEQQPDGSTRPLWSAAPPALLSDLLRQASAAGVLAPLLAHPALLLHADLGELRAAADATAEPDVVALRPVLRLLQPPSPDLASRLQAAAVQHGLTALAAATETAYGPLTFRCLDRTHAVAAPPTPTVTTGPVPTGPVTSGSVITGPVTTGPVTTGPVSAEPPPPDEGGVHSAVLNDRGTLQVVSGTGGIVWELRGGSFTAVRVVHLDGTPVVLTADRTATLEALRLDDGTALRTAVETVEPAELLDVLADGPVPLAVCAAGDLLWVARLTDGATLARLRLGRAVTALSVDADHLVHVASGDTRYRYAFDLALLDSVPATLVPASG